MIFQWLSYVRAMTIDGPEKLENLEDISLIDHLQGLRDYLTSKYVVPVIDDKDEKKRREEWIDLALDVSLSNLKQSHKIQKEMISFINDEKNSRQKTKQFISQLIKGIAFLVGVTMTVLITVLTTKYLS
jgi:hypothetical protein|tara:strand:- start:60 stop:446 length:387 start_codon:yes stop_codon:yes gene_type:complete